MRRRRKRATAQRRSPPIADPSKDTTEVTACSEAMEAENIEKNGRKNDVETMDGNDDDEGNMSKLDYELSGYGDLLAKAVQPTRGQKQLLKRLCSDRDFVLEKCTVNELRHAVYEPSFVASPEGRKLVAHFIPKIGVNKFWMLVKRVVTFEKTNKIQCGNYGEVILLAWKSAVKHGSDRLQEQLERIFMDIVYYALQHLRDNKKFMAMLEPLGRARNKQVDSMIYRTFEPNLWRCLKAANESVRYNACCLFLPFYPFVGDDDIENAEYATIQQGIIIDLLKDDSYGIRAEACRRTLSILSTHYDTFPLDFIRQCMTQTVDVLSLDSCVSVRIAVYESMSDLLHCASALNACDRALKCLFDNKGVNDRSDRVRLAAFQLLNALVGHRFIKLSEVVKMDRILKIFSIEESDTVRKEITKLLLPSYMKPGLSPDEVIRRILVMGQENETAALSFHHFIIAENLITVECAVAHAKSLVLAVYKALRSLQGIDGSETDETMSVCSDLPNYETFVEPDQGDESEKAEIWHSSRFLLNCLAVMWLSLRVTLDDEKYAKENEHLRRLLTKLFKFAFLRYRNTSIAEPVMHLGKTLNDWKEGRMVVLRELFQGCSLDEDKAAMYLEVAVGWDFLALLKFIDNAFDNMKRELCGNSPPRKREKKQKLPDDSFKRSLLYLDCIMKQPNMKYIMEQNYGVYISKYCKDLTSLRQLALEKILQNTDRFSTLTLTFENIIRGIRMQYILAVIILVSTKKDEEEEEELLKNMQGDIKWLKETLLSEFFMHLTDGQRDMMIKICETYIYLWTQQLKTYDTPVAFRMELCDAKWINKIKESTGAVRLVLSVLEMFRNLIVTVAAEDELTKIPVDSLLIPILEYVIICSKSEDLNFDFKKTAEAWLSIYSTLSNCKMLTSKVLAEQAKIVVDLVLNEFLETNKDTRLVKNPFATGVEVSEVIDFWMKKVLLKHRLLKESALFYVKDQFATRALSENVVQEDEIHRFGSLMQFLLLLRDSTKKIPGQPISNSMRKSSDLYKACVEMLREQLEGLVHKYQKNDIVLHMTEAFREL